MEDLASFKFQFGSSAVSEILTDALKRLSSTDSKTTGMLEQEVMTGYPEPSIDTLLQGGLRNYIEKTKAYASVNDFKS